MGDVGFAEVFTQLLKLVRRKSFFIDQRFKIDNFFTILDPGNTKFLGRLSEKDVDRVRSWNNFEGIVGFVYGERTDSKYLAAGSDAPSSG